MLSNLTVRVGWHMRPARTGRAVRPVGLGWRRCHAEKPSGLTDIDVKREAKTEKLSGSAGTGVNLEAKAGRAVKSG